ncbi:exonuclease domain-containing protein [Actinosynnema sp. NPDC051121]
MTTKRWYQGQALCLDVEATGLDVEADRIVSAGVARIDLATGETLHVRRYLADPGIDIPASATALHGITTEQARADGMPVYEVALLVWNDLDIGWRAGLPLVVFNAPYDLTMLERELLRVYNFGLAADGPVLDPHAISLGVDERPVDGYSLAALCADYGVINAKPHDAVDDALAAGQLVRAQVARHRAKLGRRDLRDLWRAQSYWHRSHANAHGRDPHWPLTPAPDHHGAPA